MKIRDDVGCIVIAVWAWIITCVVSGIAIGIAKYMR